MKIAAAALVVAALGLAACGTRTPVFLRPSSSGQSTAGHSAAAAATVTRTAAAPATTITKTVIKYREVRVTPSPAAPAVAPETAPPVTVPNVTDPWAVVSAYYGDIESGDYWEAWQLLDSGMTTGQTYQQFADGFSCTGSQDLTENWESGDEASFNLAATDACSGAEQYFAGTDTVVDGKIVAARVTQVG
jgi:hypothetical protein